MRDKLSLLKRLVTSGQDFFADITGATLLDGINLRHTPSQPYPLLAQTDVPMSAFGT
jgi:hypothetical protein